MYRGTYFIEEGIIKKKENHGGRKTNISQTSPQTTKERWKIGIPKERSEER